MQRVLNHTSLRAEPLGCFTTSRCSRRLINVGRQCAGENSLHRHFQTANIGRGRHRLEHVLARASPRPQIKFFNLGGENISVMKLQVGMFGEVARLQTELDRLANMDTEGDDSLYQLLAESAALIIRNNEYCSYAGATLKAVRTLDEAEEMYNMFSMEERGKFKEETLSSFGGRKKSTTSSSLGAGRGDQWLCVTFIVAAETRLRLPKLSTLSDLKQALATLGAVPPQSLVAFELLWTPQQKGDSYTRDELLVDYPTLATLV